MLAKRDVQLRYKQTALGVVWVVLQPVLGALLFAFIFGRLARLPSEGVPYGLFVFAGLISWQFVAGILQRASGSLVAESRLVTKVYFPRLLVPLASAVAVGVDLLVGLGVFYGYAAWLGFWPGWSLVLLPCWVLVAFALATGASFWLAALNVSYRDFVHAMPFLLQLWLFASPVIYSAELVPNAYRALFACNPMVGVLEGMRAALLGTSGGLTWAGLMAVGWAVLLLTSGVVFFRRVEQSFADNI